MIKLKLELFTDGSSFIDGDIRSSASSFAVYISDRMIKQGTEFYEKGTNNLAEASAILIGMNEIDKMVDRVDEKFKENGVYIDVYADSLNTVETCRDWIYKWLKRARKGVLYNSSGEVVSNQEIFKEIHKNYLTNDKFIMKFYHINSHKIDLKLYSDYLKDIKYYFVNRHKDPDLTLDIPEDIYTNKKFKEAKETFYKKNKIIIQNEELLRLLIYNKHVDKLAGDCLDENLA